MKARNTWGGSFLAMVLALLMIGGASLYYIEHQPPKGAALSGGNTLADWQKTSSTPSLSALNQTPTDSLSVDLYNDYLNLTEKGTFTAAERDAMLADLAKKHVTNPSVVPIINQSDLNVRENASLDIYVKLFAVIMSQASSVKNYEVETFTETVTKGNTSGTPELQETADLYKRIAAALLVMDVPATVASEHLDAVKSVGALAKAVENMAKWKGDPIEALTDVDTFNKTRSYVTNSMNALIATVTTLQKKT